MMIHIANTNRSNANNDIEFMKQNFIMFKSVAKPRFRKGKSSFKINQTWR